MRHISQAVHIFGRIFSKSLICSYTDLSVNVAILRLHEQNYSTLIQTHLSHLASHVLRP